MFFFHKQTNPACASGFVFFHKQTQMHMLDQNTFMLWSHRLLCCVQICSRQINKYNWEYLLNSNNFILFIYLFLLPDIRSSTNLLMEIQRQALSASGLGAIRLVITG